MLLKCQSHHYVRSTSEGIPTSHVVDELVRGVLRIATSTGCDDRLLNARTGSSGIGSRDTTRNVRETLSVRAEGVDCALAQHAESGIGTRLVELHQLSRGDPPRYNAIESARVAPSFRPCLSMSVIVRIGESSLTMNV